MRLRTRDGMTVGVMLNGLHVLFSSSHPDVQFIEAWANERTGECAAERTVPRAKLTAFLALVDKRATWPSGDSLQLMLLPRELERTSDAQMARATLDAVLTS
jgi:hypothetical protein